MVHSWDVIGYALGVFCFGLTQLLHTILLLGPIGLWVLYYIPVCGAPPSFRWLVALYFDITHILA